MFHSAALVIDSVSEYSQLLYVCVTTQKKQKSQVFFIYPISA